MKLMLAVLFLLNGFLHASSLVEEMTIISSSDKVDPSQTSTLEEKSDALLFPHITRVEDMCPYQVADILKLSYAPGSSFSYRFSVDTLASNIVQNFTWSIKKSISPKEIKIRAKEGYRYPAPATFVLSKAESDPRIVAYLGFKGCLKIARMAIENFVPISKAAQHNSKAVHNLLSKAMGSIDDFVEFFLRETIPPFPYKRGDKGFDFEEECVHHLQYYQDFIKAISFKLIISSRSSELLQILLDRFKFWLPDCEFRAIYQAIKRECTDKSDFVLLRKLLPILVKSAPTSTFTSAENIARLYDSVELRRISGVDSAFLFYVQMMPVMRAFMMCDSIDKQELYLNNFFAHFRIPTTTKAFDALFKAFDAMMIETDFIKLAARNKRALHLILEKIFRKINFDLHQALRFAVSQNLLNVSEALLMCLELDDQAQLDLLSLACRSKNHHSYDVELIAMIVSYCQALTGEIVADLAAKIDLSKLAHETDWLDLGAISLYNRKAAVKYIMSHVGSVLDAFPYEEFERSVEKLSFPCPSALFETLQLHGYRKEEADGSDYPNHTFYNLMQIILQRNYGMTFSESRIYEGTTDWVSWNEVLTFTNFVIEWNLPDVNTRFHDPIANDLYDSKTSSQDFDSEYIEAVEIVEFLRNQMPSGLLD